MFRKQLRSVSEEDRLINLSPKWVVKRPWLVRMPFFNRQEQNTVYFEAYSEKEQKYKYIKVDSVSGQMIWEAESTNGGYGTPAICNNVIMGFNRFDSVMGLDAKTGKELFTVEFGDRIRSSINVFKGLFWVTHTCHLVAIDTKGSIRFDHHINDAFLYGTISFVENLAIVTGVRFDTISDISHKYVWAINLETDLTKYEIDLGPGHVISSDTSGVWVQNQKILASNKNTITCINAKGGEICWTRVVNGDVHRHTVVADDKYVYYTTLSGCIGCLDFETGAIVWSRLSDERIVSPPAIVEGSLLVCTEASLCVMDRKRGDLYQKCAIGHTPYSAPIIYDDIVYLGGGEPPGAGALIAFDIRTDGHTNALVVSCESSRSYIESETMHLAITLASSVDGCSLDVNIISTSKVIAGKKGPGNRYTFDIPLRNDNVEGKYVLWLSASTRIGVQVEGLAISLVRSRALPRRHLILGYNQIVKEINYLNSGSSIVQFVMNKYGKDISQEEFRKIIDYVKERSCWEDADFQTWRLILKRVLSNRASTLTEFKQLEMLDPLKS